MERYIIKAGLFIDGVSKEIRKNSVIAVDNGKITKVCDGQDIEDGYRVYDFSDKTVMPGMINCHVHIDMEPVADIMAYNRDTSDVEKHINAYKNLEKYINSGVTYIRNQGSDNLVDIKLKNMLEKGTIKGPSISSSGPCITMTGGHGHFMGLESDGIDECRKSARKVLKWGADVVKIMATGGVLTSGVDPGSSQLTYEEMKVCVEEAHKAGKKSSSHAQGTDGIMNAVRAGVDSIEHGIFLSDEIIEEMLRKNTFLVPTLVAPYFINLNGVAAGIPEYAVKKSMSVADYHVRSFRKAYKEGIKIALGTDAGTCLNLHENTWYELKLMIENGMDNMDAIVAATKNASELLGIDKQYGTIEEGKVADIIVVNGNPLKNIDVLSDIFAVFKHGEKVK